MKTNSYLMKYKSKYNLMAEIDKRTNDFCRDENGSLDNYDDIWIECKGKCRVYHIGGNILQFYSPSLGRGHNILKNIYNGILGSYDKFIETITHQDKNGNDKEHKVFNFESMYSELKSNSILLDAYETGQEVLFKFKAKNFDKLERFIEPKTSHTSLSPFSVKNLRRQLGIKSEKQKCDIPYEKLEEYKQITNAIEKGNIHIYNKINDGYLTELSLKNNSSLDTFKEEIKSNNYSIKGYIFSLGEETWTEYLEYIKNYLKENM